MTKKKIRKVNVVKCLAERLGTETAKYYDKMILNTLVGHAETFLGEIVGYRNVKTPVYLTLPIPKIAKDYDNDSEYGTGEFRGFLISFEKVNLFRIGTKIEKQPIYRKQRGRTISFKRYGELK